MRNTTSKMVSCYFDLNEENYNRDDLLYYIYTNWSKYRGSN